VRDVPDLRTIRYYTTLGLLDRPAAMRGRTALYGARHVLQLVAIKRLQARGLSLAAVQERVVGLSDLALKRLAAAEAPAPAAEEAQAPAAEVAQPPPPRSANPVSREESFWRLHAAPVHDHDRNPNENPNQTTDENASVRQVPLAPGLVLALATERALDDEDFRVIRMAAAPLIEILKLRGLIGVGPSPPKKGTSR
jgi:DNA-binding transcriptional MerR regulator